MRPGACARRRLLVRALAGAVLVAQSRLSFGQNGDAADKSAPGKADGKGENGKKAGKGAVLMVVVTGNGKAVAQAEVKVKFPADGGEATLATNRTGEAAFSSSGTGTAKVRVIATGWESVLQDVVLKPGPQQLTIKLNSLPDAK